ncbi:DEAD/DEAH box helicase family protein [Cellulophaga sp. E16_2]|uniref:DEAD/DEAH box helicase n=1 Tax=Cellulophaga sp. E16_2 TaxID=2789297 RepID=UPI001A90EC9D|nr:DEAD/DEAH box helicase family protein [Cellulophaga sp. E16_2]MBO0590484.1 DEAD/DEAH box helicase family protein [Cellulophaga sp. E16_2]
MKGLPIKLWKPQIEACDLISNYINDYQSGKTKVACLIKMPTGAGKTGVMSVVSHEFFKVKSVLVVCPRDALRTQLYKEISGDFFNKISHVPKKPKATRKLLPGQSFKTSDLNEIVVTTIQKLNNTKKKEKVTFETICKKFELVIFDEGHYEPATNWSKAIRNINSPTIIFSATPFRNDHKTFEFNSDYVYTIKHNDCEKLDILRKPIFIPCKNQSDPKKFVQVILKEFKIIKGKHPKSRLIIRCDDYQSILKISNALDNLGETFISIHEQFDQTKYTWGFKNIPAINSKSDIWIHQYKLLEGIDDPNFRMLATYNPIKNSRQLIQQIGRILRNVTRIKNQKAYIIDHEDSIHQKMWESYLEYDDTIDSQIGKTFGDSLKEALSSLPAIEYIDRAFRKNYLKKPTLKLLEDVFVPLSTNILQSNSLITSAKIEKEIKLYHEDKGYSSSFHRIDNFTGLHLYISYTNSSILVNHFFFDIELNVCIHKIIGDKVLFYDSKGTSLNTYSSIFGVRPVKSSDLKKLISSRKESRLVNVSLQNSILGNNAITGHSYSAISIENTAPFLDDHGQVISSLVGYSKEKLNLLFSDKDTFRRYVGINKGRLTQSSSKVNLEVYFEWLEQIVDLINGKSKSYKTFGRYAKETKPTGNIKPLNILLDFSEIELIKFKDGSGEIYNYEIISTVEEKHNRYYTKVKLDNKEYEIEIIYDLAKERFKLESTDISKEFWNEENKDIIQYFNQNQAFRIVTNKKNLMYAFGSFFNPQLKTGSSFKIETFQLNNILIPIKELSLKFINEKGSKCQPYHRGWQLDSLFHLIDSKGIGTILSTEFENTEILVCDDMGVEVADFILCTDNKVSFIHVKGIGKKPVSKVSASKLMEVCGQAIKNIEYLSMFNTKPPAGIANKWSKEWTADKVKGKVKNRIREGNKINHKDNWKTISSKISDPSIEKEVWLVLGGILSKKEFIKQLQKTTGNSVALQTLMLLNGTLANVGSIGAKLKIFCSD